MQNALYYGFIPILVLYKQREGERGKDGSKKQEKAQHVVLIVFDYSVL